MGIKALFPIVDPACKRSHVSEFSGKSVAVDASTWLHKAAFGCSDMIARGIKPDLHITYCMKRVQMLLQNGVRVVLVFDGANLPAKKETNDARNLRRKSMREQGRKLAAAGKFKEAADCFRLATEVTFEMVADVIKACQDLPNVSCLVAPYEADAQLCFLSKTGTVDVVISEDSDLIAFGCTKILFKMDISGHGQLYEKEKLHLALQLTVEKFDFAKFRRSCILSGCDYLSSLPGIGIRKAIKFFNKVSTDDPRKFLKMLPLYLRMPKLVVSKDYIERFIEAENTFLYQVVFDPDKCYQVPLHPYPDGVDSSDFPYAGCIRTEVAILLAAGKLDPKCIDGAPPWPVQPEDDKPLTFACPIDLDRPSECPRRSAGAFVFETSVRKVVCEGRCRYFDFRDSTSTVPDRTARADTLEEEFDNDMTLNCENYSMYLSQSVDEMHREPEGKIEGPFSAGPTARSSKPSGVISSSYFLNSCELAQRKRFNPFKALSDTNLVKAESAEEVMFSSLPTSQQKRLCGEDAPTKESVRKKSENVGRNNLGRSGLGSRNLFQYFKSASSQEN